MAATQADRNLLFGILALQMDCIGRDALIDAMNAWVLDKVKPIDEILLDQGVLDPEDHALLVPIIRRHLSKHGDDASRSLAALSSATTARDAIASIVDADVQASLALLDTAARTRPPAGEAGATMPHAGSPRPAGSRFRVLRPHARGGLGEIYVARDEELGRTVALKQIQADKLGNPHLRSRFLLEAEINGNLEHPGIIPVYGLGTYDDGTPFYAMRFIQGDSLKEAIAAFHRDAPSLDSTTYNLRLRQLLGRFVDVCDAIAYAHSRGILHRDLKPANIMLGPYGETLIIDWGLAKAVGRHDAAGESEPVGGATFVPTSGSGIEPTVAGSALGTPEFMSPEQASGQLDQLGSATDVYGLGATLYALLTGRPPVVGDGIAEVLEKVRRGEIAPPRSVAPQVPAPLSAVCMKALASKPAERYPGAHALAQDIERFLADEPVTAHHEPWADRARRWMRKHRAASQAAAIALIAIAAVSTASALFVNAARQRESHARSEAENSFAQARRAVNEYLTLVSEDARLRRDLPGLQAFRKELLGKALAYYRDFLRTRVGEPGLRAEVAEAHYRIAQILSEIGTRQEATTAGREALTLLEALAREEPDRAAHRETLGSTHLLLGRIAMDSGLTDEAEDHFRRADQLFATLMDAEPDSTRMRYLRALTWSALGNLQNYWTARNEDAERSFVNARELLRALADDEPSNVDYRNKLASAHHNLSIVQANLGRLDEAEASVRQAILIGRRLAAEEPYNAEVQSFLANNYLQLGVIQFQLNQPSEVERSFEEAGTILRSVVAANPDVRKYRVQLANQTVRLGNLLVGSRRLGEAEEAYLRARDVLARLAADDPEDADSVGLLASVSINLGVLRAMAGDVDQAERHTRIGADALGDFVTTHPDVAEYRFEWANALYNLALYQRKLERLDDAEGTIDRSHKAITQLVEGDGANVVRYRKLWAQILLLRAMILVGVGRLTEAEPLFERSEAIIEREFPKDGGMHYDLACALSVRSAALESDRTGGDSAEASPRRDHAARAVSWLRRAVDAGAADASQILGDPDLAPLRNRSDFESLIGELFDGTFPSQPFAS